uniref:Uncharacterized protein n=1 Tax=Leptospira ellisii TaxID=2023197 RepID=A0A2N0BDC4_9LEPT|nr:hypothetical protein CH379_01955 [Leptospira ellisii]
MRLFRESGRAFFIGSDCACGIAFSAPVERSIYADRESFCILKRQLDSAPIAHEKGRIGKMIADIEGTTNQ